MNEMPNSKPCRKDLLMQIGHASFAVDDVKLYLLILVIRKRWTFFMNIIKKGTSC